MERLNVEGTGCGRSELSHASACSPTKTGSTAGSRGGARGGGGSRPRARRAPSLWRARIAAGTLLLGAGAVATTLPGCQSMPVVAPIIADGAIRLCSVLIKSILGLPKDSLPEGYGRAQRHDWTVDGHVVTLCLYASPTPGRPVYLQIDCEGPYHEIRARRLETPSLPPGKVEQAPIDDSTASIDGGISLDKLDCAERLLIAASLAIIEEGLRAETTFLVTNARTLPRALDFPGVTTALDGVELAPELDHEVRYGDAVTLSGPPMAVAAYAHACGVREVSFTAGDSNWRLVAHEELPVGALFRDGVFEGARVLTAHGG
ncbi:MAG: hypothetical protein RI967_1670 [Planctomycetota bacterium]